MASTALTQLRQLSSAEPVWQLGLHHHQHQLASSPPLSLLRSTKMSPTQHTQAVFHCLTLWVSGSDFLLAVKFDFAGSSALKMSRNSRHGKVLSPLSLQRRSHLVNVHRTHTSLSHFVIFISVLLCFDKESSGEEGGRGEVIKI